jgi:hypothetical protein
MSRMSGHGKPLQTAGFLRSSDPEDLPWNGIRAWISTKFVVLHDLVLCIIVLNEEHVNDHQTSFEQFDKSLPPRCNHRTGLNAFRKNCHLCPHASHRGGTLSCLLKGKKITTREKYALSAWKKLRETVLLRDGHACVICSGTETLHIHHSDGDNTNDDPENLITLCSFCHARVHCELGKPGGKSRVMQVIDYYQRDD